MLVNKVILQEHEGEYLLVLEREDGEILIVDLAPEAFDSLSDQADSIYARTLGSAYANMP